MITHEILVDDGIVVVEPTSPLNVDDFAQVANSVDAYLEFHESLCGLLIHAREFPGWESFGGFIQHIKFVKGHHQRIRRVALSCDSRFAALAPHLASHFVSAEVKNFHYDDYEVALTWLREGKKKA
jgi:hypothetical protein